MTTSQNRQPGLRAISGRGPVPTAGAVDSNHTTGPPPPQPLRCDRSKVPTSFPALRYQKIPSAQPGPGSQSAPTTAIRCSFQRQEGPRNLTAKAAPLRTRGRAAGSQLPRHSCTPKTEPLMQEEDMRELKINHLLLLFIFVFYVLAMPHSMQDFNSPPRD